jgi:signal recognition particle subunit SRP54
MFEGLSGKLQAVFRRLRGEAHLSEANIRESLREIRLALLEADVNFQVVKDLVARVQARALGEEVLRSLTPGQQFVKVVRDALEETLASDGADVRLPSRLPAALMLVGLQGSGKTSTAGKLGMRLRGQGRNPLLVPCDVYRPAAIDQLRVVARAAGLAFHEPGDGRDPVRIARAAMESAARTGYDVALVDTAGRLHLDAALMEELRRLQEAVEPFETLYVADAMTGQDAVRSAGEFHRQLPLTGVVLTKLDGDARGGAALSIRVVTGLPIKFVGTGEKPADLEPFHPDRMVSRILGMGDVLSLIERAEAAFDDGEAAQLQRKLEGGAGLTLEDFRQQLRKLRRMGPLGQLLEMIPGLGGQLPADVDDAQLKRVEAILDSMTREERRDHTLLSGSRKRRIARGSGTSVQDINRLLKQFVQMRRLMKTAAGGGRRRGGGMALPFRR